MSEKDVVLLKPIDLFNTPKDSDELRKYVEALPKDAQPLAYTVMGMTWNLCAKLTESNEQFDTPPSPQT